MKTKYRIEQDGIEVKTLKSFPATKNYCLRLYKKTNVEPYIVAFKDVTGKVIDANYASVFFDLD